MTFQVIDELVVAPGAARIYEHGWQSWSPSTWYRLDERPHRPVRAVSPVMTFRPGRPAPVDVFQGEGLLAICREDGAATRVYAAADGRDVVPSIRAAYRDGRVVVSADAPVETLDAATAAEALAEWATTYARRVDVGGIRSAPTAWCSWYQYFTDVTEQDVLDNLQAIGDRELPVDVIQIDDGWEAEVGDWHALSGRFASLPVLTARLHDAGRRAGIWVAPFLLTERSETLREHLDWVLTGPDSAPVDAGWNWDASLSGLDLTHPAVRGHLHDTFTRLRAQGFDYFKIDFLYAGALEAPRHDGSSPLAAYRSGLALIRDAIGADAYLVGCGAPILPSVGLVDAMRVAADTAPSYRSPDGDASAPSQFGATLSTVGRAWQHGRWWVNDPDCILARPGIEQRETWAAVIENYGGLRASSDLIAALDAWGLNTTRRLLASPPPPTPFDDALLDANEITRRRV